MRRSRHVRSATRLRGFSEYEPSKFSAALTPMESDIASLRREKLDLYAQLFEAAQIQRTLSGPRVLRRGEIQFASEVFAARYLSGDFVSVSTDGPIVCAALGDIAGKGLAAGMWFTNMVGLLHCYSGSADPAILATEINRHLCTLRPGAPFATMFLSRIDTSTNEVAYCTAGHFPPLLLHANGLIEKLEQGGPLLGALDGARYEVGRLTMQLGDTLLAYSDGVIECRNNADNEFGIERLMEESRRALRPSAHATVLMLLAAVQDFANGNPLCDDMSLMVIQRSSQVSA